MRDLPGANKTDHLKSIMARIDKSNALGRNMEKLGAAGDVVSFIGTGIKTAEHLNKVHEKGQAARSTALGGLNLGLDEVTRLIKKGKISSAMAEKLIRDISANFDNENSGAWVEEFRETYFEGLMGFKDTLVGLAGPAGTYIL